MAAKDWTMEGSGGSSSAPVIRHTAYSPGCPLMRGIPVVNIGEDDHERCCAEHPGLFKTSSRVSMKQNPQGHASYAQVLLNILMVLNLIPVSITASTNVITHVDTWKGLVGIKGNTYMMPTAATKYWVKIDLQGCIDMETDLLATLTTASTTIGQITVGQQEYTANLKNGMTRFITAMKGLLETGIKGIGIAQWPKLNGEITADACLQLPKLLGETKCASYKLKADVAKEGVDSALANATTGLSALAYLYAIIENYMQEVEELVQVVNALQRGTIPEQLSPVFSMPTCTTANKECHVAAPYVAKHVVRNWTKVTAVGIKGNNELRFQLITPCATKKDMLEEYQFLAMPFKDEKGRTRQVALPPTTTGIKFKDNTTHPVENAWDIEPIACQRSISEHEVYPCPEIRQILDNLPLHGGKMDLEITAVEEGNEQTFKVQNLPRNQFLLYSAKDAEITSECPGQGLDRRILPKGINLLQLGYKCTAQIPKFQQILKPEPNEYFQQEYEAVRGTVGNSPQVITVHNGRLAPPLGLYLRHVFNHASGVSIGVGISIIIVSVLGMIICIHQGAYLCRITRASRLVRSVSTYVTTNRA
jgi:hypothetical protein